MEVTVQEVVANPEQDGMGYARVFVGGIEVGQTPPGLRSEAKTWAGRVEPGNRPVRVEYWVLPGVGEWERLADSWQPRERFVRVEPGKVSRLRLRFSDDGRKHELAVARE